jgi:uncharacterized membrane protein
LDVGGAAPLSEATPQIPRPRIQGLSDLVFGLALSIGAIQLVGSLPQDHDALVTDILAFGFSFLIIINVWNRYTTAISVMPVETTTLVRLNMLLLFLVVIEPFLFNLMVLLPHGLANVLSPEISQYYALDIAGMNLILAYFTHILTLEEKNLIPRGMIHRFRVARNMFLLVSAVFLVSIVPFFWDVFLLSLPLRIVLWTSTFPLFWISRWFGSRG